MAGEDPHSDVTVLSLVGNRPQFIKAAPLSRVLRRCCREVLVHSGQHYDPELADLIIAELGVPTPEHSLAIGPGTPVGQLALIMARLEPVIARERPDIVLVYGDTTTTLAGALVASGMRVPLAHVEAGLRSFNREMPEERNRVVVDHLADLCFCPTDAAIANLAAEGITAGVHRTGDVMFDAALLFAPAAAERPGPAAHGLTPGEYLVVTAHRAASTDTPAGLAGLVAVLESLELPAIFPVHPRTRVKLEAAGAWERLAERPNLRLSPPIGYLDFTALLRGARAVLTDSGGVQKEAYFHRIPCITLRTETEWVETVSAGFNRVVGMDPVAVAVALADLELPAEQPAFYGDGHSAERIAEVLLAAVRPRPRPG